MVKIDDLLRNNQMIDIVIINCSSISKYANNICILPGKWTLFISSDEIKIKDHIYDTLSSITITQEEGKSIGVDDDLSSICGCSHDYIQKNHTDVYMDENVYYFCIVNIGEGD